MRFSPFRPADHSAPVRTEKAEQNVVDAIQENHRNRTHMHVILVACARFADVAQLEGVDQVKASVQSSGELRRGGEMSVELLDEEHDINRRVAVDLGSDLHELAVHLHRTLG